MWIRAIRCRTFLSSSAEAFSDGASGAADHKQNSRRQGLEENPRHPEHTRSGQRKCVQESLHRNDKKRKPPWSE